MITITPMQTLCYNFRKGSTKDTHTHTQTHILELFTVDEVLDFVKLFIVEFIEAGENLLKRETFCCRFLSSGTRESCVGREKTKSEKRHV